MTDVTPETLSSPDQRRRKIIAAGHAGDERAARAGLTDDDPSVRRAALGALARCRALSDDHLRHALGDPAPSVRQRAALLSIDRPGVTLLALLADPDDSVVEQAAFAVGEQAQHAVDQDAPPAEIDIAAAVRSLAALAVDHEDALVRESAVAALGAIGDPAGRDAVLGATADKPAVRRRAVIALAAFEGTEVDAALDRALSDRDWQVRQIAEDLVDPDRQADVPPAGD